MSGTPPTYAPEAGWLLDRFGEPCCYLVARIQGIGIDDQGRIITLNVLAGDCDSRWPYDMWNILQPTALNAEAMKALLTVAEGLTQCSKRSLNSDSVAAACRAFAAGVRITLPIRMLSYQ
jgi:hypothetical protein